MAILDSLQNKKDMDNICDKFFNTIRKEGNFVGNLYDLDYEYAKVLINDYDKNNVMGLPHGCLLLAIYNNELRENELEGILLRVIGISEIPQKYDIVQSLTDMYMSKKESRENIKVDIYTKYFYQFSGLICRILGTFYEDENKQLVFGTDVENFLGAHNYKVYKPKKEQLEIIINKNIYSNDLKEKIGELRYASSQSYDKAKDYAAEVYLKTDDIVAKRSGFFGMTRTGKSNTIKIIISAIENLNNSRITDQIGQIVFDINGEYTFTNKQDKNSIYDIFKQKVLRFSSSLKKIEEYKDVRPIQYDFYNDITLEESFSFLCDEMMLANKSHYIANFANINMFESVEKNSIEYSAQERKKALYKCILCKAGFEYNKEMILNFSGFTNNNNLGSISKAGVKIDEACAYFKKIKPDLSNIDEKYKNDKDYEALLRVFHAKGGSGYKFLATFSYLHSIGCEKDYKQDINFALREGKIVLIDLSTISTQTQQKYIDKLCSYIFANSMEKFTKDKKVEYIQMYFEEAHNIFPKDDKDLKNIYNRIAKEGAKLNIGISYSTQEVSSISPSILKNTQNWFISHLNNKDEIKTLEKYYDFADFSQSILKNSDVGFSRIKTHSNNFIIPVQIKNFNDE